MTATTTSPPSPAIAVPARPPGAVLGDPSKGLTNDEARRLLTKFGTNAMPDTAMHPLRTSSGRRIGLSFLLM